MAPCYIRVVGPLRIHAAHVSFAALVCCMACSSDTRPGGVPEFAAGGAGFGGAVTTGGTAGASGAGGLPVSGCNLAYDCGPGQTCSSMDGLSWECVTAGTLAWGEACDPTGPESCGVGLACVSFENPIVGACVAWCSASRPCSSGVCLGGRNPVGGKFNFCAGGPCGDHYDCPAGQTCATTDGIALKCVSSGPGKVGDPCSATLGSPVTCGDHLSCLATGDPRAGSCVEWCDPQNPTACPAGQTCRTVPTVSGPVDHFCL